MKNLKPSHREKKRYLFIAGKDASWKIIEETILEFIGVLGFAEACPSTIKSGEGRIIISVNRKAVDKVRASFLISGRDLRIEKVSGTLKKLKGN